VVFLAIFLIQPSGEENALVITISIFSVVLGLGLADFFYSLRLTEICFENKGLFTLTTQKYLSYNGWHVKNNNKKYFYAWKMQGGLWHYFYMVYENDKAYACFLYDYPFPFSAMTARREIKVLSENKLMTGNKKRNEMDGSVEPPIR